MTWYCSISVVAAQVWDSSFILINIVLGNCIFGRLNWLYCRVLADSPHKMSNYVLYSDTSATGCGAHLNINDEHFTFFFTLIRRLV